MHCQAVQSYLEFLFDAFRRKEEALCQVQITRSFYLSKTELGGLVVT